MWNLKIALLFLVLGCALILVFQILYSEFFLSNPTQCTHNPNCPVPYLEKKREIAQRLLDIYIELSAAAKYKHPPNAKNLVEIKGIISELDPASALSRKDREMAEPEPTNSSVMLDVCPEKFMGEYYGFASLRERMGNSGLH